MYNWGSTRRFSRIFKLTLKLGLYVFYARNRVINARCITEGLHVDFQWYFNFARWTWNWVCRLFWLEIDVWTLSYTSFKFFHCNISVPGEKNPGASVLLQMNFSLIYPCQKTYKPNWNVKRQNWDFHANRPVDFQCYIVGIFHCQNRIQ